MKPLIAIGLLMVLTSPLSAKWINVAGEWDQYRLNEGQRKWFNGVRAPSGVPCCDIADGHPTQMEHRQDDKYWIPDPIHLDEPRQWIKVPDEAVVKNVINPVGVATVWWVQQADSVYIRCFVREAEG